jgi:hypothetical protein
MNEALDKKNTLTSAQLKKEKDEFDRDGSSIERAKKGRGVTLSSKTMDRVENTDASPKYFKGKGKGKYAGLRHWINTMKDNGRDKTRRRRVYNQVMSNTDDPSIIKKKKDGTRSLMAGNTRATLRAALGKPIKAHVFREERDKKSLPFAVCTKNVGRENKAKYERCVMKVKATVNEGKLCPKGKAAAKRKFSVYPSAYANMYASAVCSGKVKPGGKKNEAYERLGSLLTEKKSPAWQRSEGKNPKGGLNAKGVASYRAANPGSKLKTAVTTKPSKLKKGSKAAKRRRSFCARMSGMRKRQKASNNTGKDRLSLSLKKWNC